MHNIVQKTTNIIQKPLIGICGKARVGKNLVADILLSEASELHISKYLYAFATPIKTMLEAGLNISMADNIDKEEIIPILGVSRRDLMTTLGTDWGRNTIKSELWLIMATLALQKKGNGMIITDVRFENEAKWIRNHGGVILHVENPNVLSISSHVSEQGVRILAEDFIVENSGTIDELRSKIRTLIYGSETGDNIHSEYT